MLTVPCSAALDIHIWQDLYTINRTTPLRQLLCAEACSIVTLTSCHACLHIYTNLESMLKCSIREIQNRFILIWLELLNQRLSTMPLVTVCTYTTQQNNVSGVRRQCNHRTDMTLLDVLPTSNRVLSNHVEHCCSCASSIKFTKYS